jgi:hypothetical protein
MDDPFPTVSDPTVTSPSTPQATHIIDAFGDFPGRLFAPPAMSSPPLTHNAVDGLCSCVSDPTTHQISSHRHHSRHQHHPTPPPSPLGSPESADRHHRAMGAALPYFRCGLLAHQGSWPTRMGQAEPAAKVAHINSASSEFLFSLF